jgi:TM2 domain-containing membrane protein YozV
MKLKRNKTVTLVLAILFGFLGIHKFYLGRIRSGVFYLLFAWTFIPLLLAVIDIIVLIVTDKEKFDKRYNNEIE